MKNRPKEIENIINGVWNQRHNNGFWDSMSTSDVALYFGMLTGYILQLEKTMEDYGIDEI